jgi:hypothetical protein
MATSGTTTLQYTRNDLIDAAISTLGVLARGQTPTTEDYTRAATKLNMLVAKLRTQQLPLWKRTEYTLTLVASQISYTLGDGLTLDTPYPLKMLEAYSIPTSGNTRIDVEIISSSEFNILPYNTSGGQPIKLNYQPFVNYGVVKIWPTPDTSVATNYTMKLVYQAPFEYFTASTDTMDMPEEYYLPIVYNLAVLIAPEWGIPIEDRRELKKEAKEYLDAVESFGEEDASLFFQVDRRY